MNPQHFGSDPADIRIQIRINPEIWEQIPDHFRLGLDALAEVCALCAQSINSIIITLFSSDFGFCRAMLCKHGLCRHAVSVCVCLSVRPSRSWILSKRINVSSNFFHHHVATRSGCSGPDGRVSEYRTRNQEVAGSTHTRSTASNFEQVANLLCAQANSAL